MKVEGIKCSIVDTTGAGDAFWGGFLYKLVKLGKNPGLLTREDAIECLEFANLVAAKCISRYGAIPAMPDLIELERGV